MMHKIRKLMEEISRLERSIQTLKDGLIEQTPFRAHFHLLNISRAKEALSRYDSGEITSITAYAYGRGRDRAKVALANAERDYVQFKRHSAATIKLQESSLNRLSNELFGCDWRDALASCPEAIAEVRLILENETKMHKAITARNSAKAQLISSVNGLKEAEETVLRCKTRIDVASRQFEELSAGLPAIEEKYRNDLEEFEQNFGTDLPLNTVPALFA